MQIVIDIPQIMYGAIKQYGITFLSSQDKKTLRKSIANGVPLPKGHGRLIDADELYSDFIDGTEGYDCQTWNRIEIGDIIEDAQTIIEGSESE